MLRFEDETPAYKTFYKAGGVPHALSTFRKDLEKRKIINSLESLPDLESLTALALDKIYWSIYYLSTF